MRMIKSVPTIDVKRTFVIADHITHRKSAGNNRKFLKDLSEKEFNQKLSQAKKAILKLKEKDLDKLISPKWPKRLRSYNNSQWVLAEVDPKEVGVWSRAGNLPLAWTRGSLFETAKKVKVALDTNSKLLKQRPKHSIPNIMKLKPHLSQKERYLYPIVFKTDTGTQGRKRLKRKMKGDIDDGCMRSIALAISGTTLTYDNSGNLIAYGTTTYAYDYRNRLTQAAIANATSTYAYDHEINRTRQTVGSTTTWYPNKYFSRTATTTASAAIATTTAYIYASDVLVATVDRVFSATGAVTSTTTHYVHPDHLGSTNVVTDSGGNVVQTLDYYPYGSTRVNSRGGTANSARQYIGQFADASTLSYLNARFYDSLRGQFLNQDPVFWAQNQDIFDPQSLNSYSYSLDNPVTKKDPSGKQVALPSISPASTNPYIVGATFIVITGAYILSQLGDVFKDGKAEILVDTRPSDVTLHLPMRNPDDLQPPRNNSPKWQRFVYFMVSSGAVIYTWREQFEEEINYLIGFLKRSAGKSEEVQANPMSSPQNPSVSAVSQSAQLTAPQISALQGIQSTFVPTNPAQAAAVKDLLINFSNQK